MRKHLEKTDKSLSDQGPTSDLLQTVAYGRIKVVNEAVEKVLSLQANQASPHSQNGFREFGVSPYKFVTNAAQRLKEFEAKSIQAIEDIYKAVSK
jgi:hypothetical protein